MTQKSKSLKGKTIGLISPSSPIEQETLDISIAYFKNIGCKVKVGSHVLKSGMMSAGSDIERAEDIMRFYKDPEISAIAVTRGGVGSIRTLPFLDYNIIKKNPKPLIGFSDTTALQLGIFAKTCLVSYSGFTGSDYSQGRLNDLIDTTLKSCCSQLNYKIDKFKTVNTGVVTAPLIGGNLMSLVNLMGTEFQPDYSGKILFIEDVSLEPYIIDGMLSQLYVSGILNAIAGIIIGQFIDCEPNKFSKQPSLDELIGSWCEKIRIPCVKEFPYGHMDDRCVLPIGIMATLDATNCTVDIIFDE